MPNHPEKRFHFNNTITELNLPIHDNLDRTMYGNTSQYSKAYNRDLVSPPLHHPVPQHPIPPMRSPSNLEDTISSQRQHVGSNPYIPQQQQQQGSQNNQSGLRQDPSTTAFHSIGVSSDNNYGAEGASERAPGNGFGQYSNIFSDPSAQIGINVGRNALSYGQDYVARHVSKSAKDQYFEC